MINLNLMKNQKRNLKTDNWSKFNETLLAKKKKKIYNKFRKYHIQNISNSDYQHAKNIQIYKLDPAGFYSTTGLAWIAALKSVKFN